MGHPTIEEFCRAGDFQPSFLRRCQRVFRDEVQPQLDERERLLVENAELKAQIAALTVTESETARPAGKRKTEAA